MLAKKPKALGNHLGFPNASGVDCTGLSGDLVLCWTSDVIVWHKSCNKSHIDAWVASSEGVGRTWRFMGFYGEPMREQRGNSWYLLNFLRNETDLPWLCAGDFNKILDASEYFGNGSR